MTDIEAFDNAGPGGATSAGAIAHETAEQTTKAEMGIATGDAGRIGTDAAGNSMRLDYQAAHKNASLAEDKVNGNTRVQGVTYTYLEKDGSKTQQTYFNAPVTGDLQVTKKRIP